MIPKWSIALLVTLAVGLLISVAMSTSDKPSNRVTSKCENTVDASHSAEQRPAYFNRVVQGSGIPNIIKLPIGEVKPLADAKSRSEIVSWADGNCITRNSRLSSVWTQKPPTQWLALMYPSKSGVVAWMVHLYVYHPSGQGDNRPWKLVFVGESSNIDGLYTVECVYINPSDQSLVLADRDGRGLSRLQIAKVLKWIKAE